MANFPSSPTYWLSMWTFYLILGRLSYFTQRLCIWSLFVPQVHNIGTVTFQHSQFIEECINICQVKSFFLLILVQDIGTHNSNRTKWVQCLKKWETLLYWGTWTPLMNLECNQLFTFYNLCCHQEYDHTMGGILNNKCFHSMICLLMNNGPLTFSHTCIISKSS